MRPAPVKQIGDTTDDGDDVEQIIKELVFG
jgi:hypothetical protein